MIEPVRASHKFGEVLSCTANGNPSPSYQWKNFMTNSTVNGNELSIVNRLSTSHILFYQCVATNSVAGKSVMATKNISFTIFDPSAMPGKDYKTIFKFNNKSILLKIFICASCHP